nr:S49 family peptidase [Klebsiella pneumoniae]
MIDEMYETFTGSVAEYRGLKQQAIIDTQAGLYFGPGAVSAGLADEVSDPQAAINAIAAKYQQPRQNLHSDAGSRDGPANQNVTRRKHKPRHLKQPAGCFLCQKEK